MNDKFENFMKKNTPPEEGKLKVLRLPEKKNWFAGVAVSTLLVATLAVVLVKQEKKYETMVQTEEALDVAFDDEFPAEYQDVDEILENL
jgi:hypothetical protein